MTRLFEFIKTTLIGGVLVIAPAAAIVLLLAKVASLLRHALDPIAHQLPPSVHFPYVIEIASLIGVCFVAGLLVRTDLGRRIGAALERNLFEKLPGYALFKALTGQSLAGIGEGAVPALIDMEGGLVPGLIIERHDGFVTVFVPSPPVPTSGQCYIFTADMAHPVDVSLAKFVACISKWGLGSQELRLHCSDLPPR